MTNEELSNLISLAGLTKYDAILKDYIKDNAHAAILLDLVDYMINENWRSGKILLARALNNKGSNISDDGHATMQELRDAINNIKSGDGVFTGDATATAEQILAGATAYVNDIKVEGTMPNNPALTRNILYATSAIDGSLRVGIPNGAYLQNAGSNYPEIVISTSMLNEAAPNLVSYNIRYGANIFGTNGSFTSDATARATHILSGVTAYANGEKLTGRIPIKTAATITPGTTDQTINAGYYLSGAQTILGSSALKPENIKSGVSIFGVEGEVDEGMKLVHGSINFIGTSTTSFTLPRNTIMDSIVLKDNNSPNAILKKTGFGWTNPANAGISDSSNIDIRIISADDTNYTASVTYGGGTSNVNYTLHYSYWV